MIPGVAYPSSTPRKQYRKITKTLLVDSRDRNPGATPSQYSVKLPRTYENVYAVTLRSAEIPISWYTISAGLGNNKLTVTQGATVTTLVIADGAYTSTTFATAINALFSTLTPTITAAYNTPGTNKMVFTSASAFTFNFASGNQVQTNCGTQQVNVQNTATWWGLGYFMGFYQTNRVATNVSGTFTLLADFLPQFNPYNYVLMELDFINKEDETSIDNRLSGRIEGCFAKIPLNGNTGDIIFFREFCCPMNRSVLSPPIAQLKTLNVKFRDHAGRVIDFNNIDHSFTLELELLDNNFDEYSSLDFTPR